ncbi:AraC family transcriptional regulator [Methylovirgula ligni]|uniref:Helix-turn-helix protein n=1 Tax=Methylovirgula ligni TaxID=569860 RepID=A0A3D9Z3L6_9HYPH|nr:AraC family transcriptional regulator [Methylovirgula ligni]QAY95310.1 AraC family transcriptional regulator [Methylovirgula ligni]REF89385.1 helix-turn-helix protein [Methylovirgula ligni]
MAEELELLRALAARHAGGRHQETPIPRVAIHRGCAPTEISAGLFEPKLCLVLQGAKQIMIGDQVLRYDPANYFIATVELPVTGRIIEASAAQPYLGLSLTLDWQSLAALIPDVPGGRETAGAGFAVSPVTAPFLDAWLRLLRLIEAPQDIAVLAPLCEREILYRLLQGPQGYVLRQIVTTDSRLSQIRKAIGWIRENYNASLQIESLASLAGMSTASFHRHFKAATTMSPLQYQKTLRLQQARQLMIANPDATRAAYAVGYESASQFSREYARMFGAPPARDALRLRGIGAASEEISAA